MYAIFSIDNEKNPAVLNQFAAYFWNHPERKDNLLPAIGVYKGQAEHSFIVSPEDWENIVKPSDFIKGQESVLFVAMGNKMECHLEFLATGEILPLGHMCEVSAQEAILSGDFTYLPSTGVYYIAADRNPDDYQDDDEAAAL